MQPTLQMPQNSGRPFVQFERRGVERRRPLDHPTEPGMLYVEDVDFVKVTPMGSRDIFERIAVDWFKSLEQKVSMGMESADNQQHFIRLYEAWKKGEELPLEGTPIKGWPLASKAEQQRCIELHLLTVENLANCNAEATNRLGMGGQTLRNRATEWLKARNETGPLVARLDAMQLVLERIEKRNSELEAENRVLRGMKNVEAVTPAPTVERPTPRPAVDDNLEDQAVDHELAQI